MNVRLKGWLEKERMHLQKHQMADYWSKKYNNRFLVFAPSQTIKSKKQYYYCGIAINTVAQKMTTTCF